MTPNEWRATPSGLIWSAALRDWSFSRPAVLSQAYVQQAHFTYKALQEWKNDRIDSVKISVNRSCILSVRLIE